MELERPPEGASLVPLNLPEGKKPKKAAVNTLENTLSNLRAKKFIDDKKPAALGLDKGKAYVVTATLADGSSVELHISKQTDGTDPYATAKGGLLDKQLFTLNKYQADNLQKEPTELYE